MTLNLYSGNCKVAVCGLPVEFKDMRGKDVHTGDIVLLWSRSEHDDPEMGFTCPHGLTAVVEDKYTTYSNGEIKIEKDGSPFVMGIRGIDLKSDKFWGIEIVKKHYNAIDGERWTEYGFNYKVAELEAGK